jgi:hypothetical protein
MKCNFRNCERDISFKRKGTKYCSKLCKDCENKYTKRELDKLKIEKENIKDILNTYNEKSIGLIELYKQIYK